MVGLIGGAVIFFTIGIVPLITLYRALHEGETPSVFSAIGTVIGLTGCATLAYAATQRVTTFVRKDWVRVAGIAVVTGIVISIAIWLLSQNSA